MDDPSKKSAGRAQGARSGQVQVTETEESREVDGVISNPEPFSQLSVAGYSVDLGAELPPEVFSKVQAWVATYVKIAQKRNPGGTLEEQLSLSVALFALKRHEDRSALSEKKSYIAKLEEKVVALEETLKEKENSQRELEARISFVEEEFERIMDSAIATVDAARGAISNAATDSVNLDESDEELKTSRISRDLLNLETHDSSEGE